METDATSITSSSLLPPKPEEPLDTECCGTGCTPCVFDIYKEKLKRWGNECEEIQSGSHANTSNSTETDILSPYDYADYKVEDIIDDCSSCKIIRFRKSHLEKNAFSSPKKFPVKLGQHIVLRIEGKSRQYTVLDVRNDTSFTIIFKIYESGQLTPLVGKLVVGDNVEMRGPFGKEFVYTANAYQNLLMIAAGTGIAPFYRIISRVLENENDETRILLLYACHNENQVLLLNKIKEWSRSWNFRVQYFFSNFLDARRAHSLHYGANIICGRIEKTVIENLDETKNSNSLFLICGTKSFDKDMLNYLKSTGINEDKIKMF